MQPAATASKFPRLDGLCVLVVDDMPDVRATILVMLRTLGARGIGAGSAAAALQALERERPDVLIADISMPDEDGYSLIRKIRALPPERGGEVAAAAFTAADADADLAALLAAGFDFHLAKPVSMEFLMRAIATLALLRPRRPAPPQPFGISSATAHLCSSERRLAG